MSICLGTNIFVHIQYQLKSESHYGCSINEEKKIEKQKRRRKMKTFDFLHGCVLIYFFLRAIALFFDLYTIHV